MAEDAAPSVQQSIGQRTIGRREQLTGDRASLRCYATRAISARFTRRSFQCNVLTAVVPASSQRDRPEYLARQGRPLDVAC